MPLKLQAVEFGSPCSSHLLALSINGKCVEHVNVYFDESVWLCSKILIMTGCEIEKAPTPMEHKLSSGASGLSKRQARLLDKLWEEDEHSRHVPKSLLEITIHCVRKYMQSKLSEDFNNLPLPKQMIPIVCKEVEANELYNVWMNWECFFYAI